MDYSQHIVNTICRHFGADLDRIYQKGGDYHIYADARHFIWFVLHCKHKVRCRVLANEYNMNLNTIKKGIAKIKNAITIDPYYKRHYKKILEEMENPITGK